MLMEHQKSNLAHVCNIWVLRTSLRNPQLQNFLINTYIHTYIHTYAYTHTCMIFISMKYVFRFHDILGIVLSLIPRSSESNK